MIDKKQLIEELLECVQDATDTETKITGLTMCATLFESVLDEAINYSQCCKSDSEQLPSKEEMNIKLYALTDELKTDDKQTEKVYFESGFRYCQQVIKEHLQK